MTETFTKTFKTIPEQVELLRSRGMEIPDESSATRILETVGYYRLSGYWYPYRKRRPVPTADPKVLPGYEAMDEFASGTTLEQVVRLYEFDRKLKLLVLDAIERIEVAMRMRIGHALGQGHPFAHCDMHALGSGFTAVENHDDPLHRLQWLSSDHSAWLGNVRRLETSSKEEFVKHYQAKYGHTLPVWVVTEILTFGGLSKLYEGLKPKHRDEIAESFGIMKGSRGDGAALASWMTTLNYIRNTCAHHARLWNKNIAVQVGQIALIDELKHADHSKQRVYAALAVLAFLIVRTNPESTWRQDIADYVQKGLKAIGQPESKIGCPAGWEKESIWDPGYLPPADPYPAEHRALRREFETVGASDVGLVLAPTSEPRSRTSIVRRERSAGRLLGLKLGEAFDYPVFQLEKGQSRIHPVAAYANHKLNAADDPWGVARWWVNADVRLNGRTPLNDLESGLLTEAVVDILSGPNGPDA
ncbi:Abi family protein [Rhodococcus sp. USK13]|uniref:Abi family protein n=1 Tax=Rhodococcus sp. USK13 TaxID=2806442 RepID=UPI001BCC96DC|nr:Abi family protein [Rhodococcus sp. USK13]